MVLSETPLTPDAILRSFYRYVPYLFLGSAFMSVGLVSIGLSALRRKLNPLLLWMGAFAFLYGLRMWLQDDLLHLAMRGNTFLERLPDAINFVVPIPAFSYFRAAGFLGSTRKMTWASWLIYGLFACLAAATMIFGPLSSIYIVNTVVVSIMLWIVLVRNLRNRKGDRDFKIVRAGVLAFVIFAIWDNTMGRSMRTEPYGFAVLLACIGYVTARRTLQRDVELGEIQKELDLARRIQLSILPGDFPESTDFCVAARYLPMTSVAGDLYDYLVAGNRQAGLFIADVSGHGVPAALIASMVKMAATSQRAHAAHPAQLLAGMNAALCGNTQGQLVTAAYVHLDATTGALRYSAAGHPAMLLLRSGTVIEVAENGLVLAASEESTYSEKTLALQAGDRLLLYTDGLVEARNSDGKMFGEEAVTATLSATAALTPAQAADRLIASAQQWAASQDDDLTVLVCDYLPA
jgi:sigma-B regulation protein RsbU (phosphoserine phosphatase)